VHSPTVAFTVDCLKPDTHVYRVTLDARGFGPGPHEVELPVWTPGAYEIQDYARHLFDVRARSPEGKPLPLDKVRKNAWRLEATDDAFTVTYQVYANQLDVDTSHLDGTHAYWNGATLFVYVDGRKDLPVDVYIKAPAGWRVSTGLDGDPNDLWHYRAPNYDILVDCPVEIGTHRVYTFDVDMKPHTVAIWGHGNQDDDRLVADTRRIVETQAAMFGGLPYAHYTFIYHLADHWGGLEHLNSTTCLMPRESFKPWKAYRRVLGLIAHEFFHLWNVKRIHPEQLGPFDYNREVHTHLLWAMEGFTDYYAALTLRRAGLFSVTDYLQVLAEDIKRYEGLPGRYVMDLAWSSFDTWIKLYKPNEDSANRSISYYLKGHLVGLLMDLEIRRRTDNRRSLDDVLRLLYERWGREGRGFPERVYQETVEEVAGGSMADFFARYITGVDELPLDAMLDTAGLRIHRLTKNPDLHPGEDDDEAEDRSLVSDPPVAWIGAHLALKDAKVVAEWVATPGPAAEQLYAGDELIALDGRRVTDPKHVTERIRADKRPGDTVTVTAFRRGELITRDIVLGEAQPNTYRITRVDDPTPAQQATYQSWLAASWPD
jgi:predicted metalloprotease with PDZ domain